VKRALVAIAVGAASIVGAALLASHSGNGSVFSRACTNPATATAVSEYNDSQDFSEWLPNDDETHCRLRRAVLTEDEVPDGLEYEPNLGRRSLYAGSDLRTSCAVFVPSILAGVEADYVSFEDEDYRFVGQQVVALESGDAARLFAAVRHSCRFSDDDKAGVVVPFPAFGDDTLAVRQSLSDDEGDDFTSIYVSKGQLLLAVYVVGVDQAELARLVGAAYLKLGRIGMLPEPDVAEGDGCYPPELVEGDPELAVANMQLNDMPVGWTEYVPHCSTIDRDAGTCDDVPFPEHEASATARFLTDRRALWSVVRRYSSEDAPRYVQAVKASIASPSECTSRIQDRQYTWRTEAIEHELGDDVVVWRDSSGETTWWTAMLSNGNFISEIIYARSYFQLNGGSGQFDDSALKEMTPWVETARSRLSALSSSD
jgi:hypothetical protein